VSIRLAANNCQPIDKGESSRCPPTHCAPNVPRQISVVQRATSRTRLPAEPKPVHVEDAEGTGSVLPPRQSDQASPATELIPREVCVSNSIRRVRVGDCRL
jgi:hypothetical protein